MYFQNQLVKGGQGNLVPYLINTIGDSAPWFVGLLAVCALAAMQSTGAAYMSTCASMLTRDIYKKFFRPKMSHAEQKFFGRICVVIVVGAALMVATFSKDALVSIGRIGGSVWFPNVGTISCSLLFPMVNKRRCILGSVSRNCWCNAD